MIKKCLIISSRLFIMYARMLSIFMTIPIFLLLQKKTLTTFLTFWLENKSELRYMFLNYFSIIWKYIILSELSVLSLYISWANWLARSSSWRASSTPSSINSSWTIWSSASRHSVHNTCLWAFKKCLIFFLLKPHISQVGFDATF